LKYDLQHFSGWAKKLLEILKRKEVEAWFEDQLKESEGREY